MGFWSRLTRRYAAIDTPSVTLVENGRVSQPRASWPDVERAIRKYYLGDDWGYFDIGFGDPAARRYAIVSGKTRCADLFAVLVTFDGRTFHSPEAESGIGTYALGASEVYPDARCVRPETAFRVGRTFCERGELDPTCRWHAFAGTGFVTAQTPRELRDDADRLRMVELFQQLTDSAPGSAEAARLGEELRELDNTPKGVVPDAESDALDDRWVRFFSGSR